MISGDEIANIISSWDTDDELSSVEGDAETQLGSSISFSARPAFTATNSSEDESDDEKSRTQDATSSDITGKNGSLWTSSQPALTGRTAAQNVFTAIPVVAYPAVFHALPRFHMTLRRCSFTSQYTDFF